MNTQTTETLSGKPGQQQNVLIVDDSKVMRLALKKILSADYQVLEASDGEEAWEVLSQNHGVSMVFSDLSMPNLDGFGLLDRIRKSSNQNIKDLPFIVITGNEDDDGTREKAIGNGATDFITKPFKSAEIKARAKSHLGYREKIEDITSTLEQKIPLEPVTNLAKQEYFEQRASQLLSYASRHHADLSLLLLRLEINPLTLKERMDSLLQEIAHVVREYTRNEDISSHYEGGDFRILLPGVDLTGAEKLADRFGNFISGFEASNSGDVEIKSVTIGASSVLRSEARISLDDLVGIAEKNATTTMLHDDVMESDVMDHVPSMDSAVNTEDMQLKQVDVSTDKDSLQDYGLVLGEDHVSFMPDETVGSDSEAGHTQIIHYDEHAFDELSSTDERENAQETEQAQFMQLDESLEFNDPEVTQFIDTAGAYDLEIDVPDIAKQKTQSTEDTVMLQIEQDVQNLLDQEDNEIPVVQPAAPMSSDKEDALEYANKLKMHIEERAKNIEHEREKIRENARKREQEAEERARKRAEEYARKRSEIEASLNPDESRVDEQETARIREALKQLREKESRDKMDADTDSGLFSGLLSWLKNLFARK